MAYEILRAANKGQMAMPVSARKILGIREGDVAALNNEDTACIDR